MEKYIARCFYGFGGIEEKRVKSLRQAIRIKREMQEKRPKSCCVIIKVPFRKRHSDFPIWFSLVSLLLVEFAPEVDSYIRRILQIVQLWK